MRNAQREVYRQGHFDGLCGVYSILNYLSFLGEDESRSRKAFLVAVRTIEDAGQLTAKNISSGIWQGQLVNVARAVFSALKLDVQTCTLGTFRKEKKSDDPFELAASLGPRDAIIFNFRNPGHWMLSHSGTARQFIAMDSALGEERSIRATFLTDRKIAISKGLVFLNAQKN